jgi:hypothetical protein
LQGFFLDTNGTQHGYSCKTGYGRRWRFTRYARDRVRGRQARQLFAVGVEEGHAPARIIHRGERGEHREKTKKLMEDKHGPAVRQAAAALIHQRFLPILYLSFLRALCALRGE